MADDNTKDDDYEALKAQEQANLQESEDARMKRLQQAAAEAPQPFVSTTPPATKYHYYNNCSWNEYCK